MGSIRVLACGVRRLAERGLPARRRKIARAGGVKGPLPLLACAPQNALRSQRSRSCYRRPSMPCSKSSARTVLASAAGRGVGFAWGGVPHRSSEGLRFSSALNCAKFSLAMVRFCTSSLICGPLILVAGSKFLEDRPKLGIRLLKTVDHLPRGLEEPPRIFAQPPMFAALSGIPEIRRAASAILR